jgi:guanylate kinase
LSSPNSKDAGCGTIFVVSAPSGGGKGTILSAAYARDNRLAHTVSATTRKPREGEIDGKHYHFVTREQFNTYVAEGQFLEWAEVHENCYGTLNSELSKHLSRGEDVVLELDVQGMRSVKGRRNDIITVFIMPPSQEVWEQRLRARGGMDEDELALRIRNGLDEMAASSEYDYVVVNDDLEEAVDAFIGIVHETRKQNGRV